MEKFNIRTLLPHLIAIAIFIGISFVFFSPLFQGKQLKQHDISMHKGMAKEIVDFRAKHHSEPLWTNSMFGGMPSYQISTLYPSNWVSYLDRAVHLGIPGPANLVFIYLLGFYLLLIVLKVDYRLAIGGAIAFAFSSYFFIILEAGHNSKANAIGYMAPVIAGILLTFKRKYLIGGAITALTLALEINANHLQITYYLFFIILILGVAEFYAALKNKELPAFGKAVAVIAVGALVAVGCNFNNLYSTYDYGKFTTRGKSELAVKKVSSGLDKDYALGWSYGVSETMTLLIPNFMGGASQIELGTGSVMYEALVQNQVPPVQAKQYLKQMPVYWGDQPFTSGPTYVGAIVCFLFVLGLFLVKGPVKWWLLTTTVLSILLAWGKNFQGFTDLFFDYMPGYNKFRAVSMTLVIAELTIPLLGFMALKKIFSKEVSKAESDKALKLSLYIVGGLSLLFALLPGLFFDFTAAVDEQLKSSGNPDWFINALREDRKNLLRTDAFRSFAFILLAWGLIWAWVHDKVASKYVYLGLSFLILMDLGLVTKRYLHNDNFVSKMLVQVPFQPSAADAQIMQDPDPDYRVMNTTVSTFNDASTSYFHKSIGGYHGAKLKRYQELIENQISKNNMAVLNMLNAKYFIVQPEKATEPMAQQNPGALGHAWFVPEYKIVANADSELNALSNFNPARTAYIDQRYAPLLNNFKGSADTAAAIKLLSYEPNDLKYESKSKSEGLVVFSEIYYEHGWNAYVDGKLTPHLRANYVLRALLVPGGQHSIEFKFEPASYALGEKVGLISSILLFVGCAAVFFFELKKNARPVVSA
jgi:hypothetical protein